MEEVAGLEPTHTGFAIPGITNFAIPPKDTLFLVDEILTKLK